MDNSRAFIGYDNWLASGADQVEPPEDCPICHRPNYDLDKDEPICPEYPEYCSKECADEDVKRMRADDDAQAVAFGDHEWEWEDE